jgi:F420-dependent oxidoreductase-like protein
MQIGIHPMDFTWLGEPATIAPTLRHIVERADEIGLHSVWPMDHFFQIGLVGADDDPMIEAYSTLAWAAARTERVQLGALVTGTPYRHPGVLVKTVTTLDVLSGGRAWLGIGAGWYEAEALGLGVPFPSVVQRFEWLEDTLQLAHQMFDGDDRPFHGRHVRAERPINHPLPIRRPPILIGGGGERKTLRLVAAYADACNLFEAAAAEKLVVLRRHCDEIGRPFDEIARTTTGQIGDRSSVDAAVERFGRLAELGIDLAVVDVPDAGREDVFDFLAAVVDQVTSVGRPAPSVIEGGPGRALTRA